MTVVHGTSDPPAAVLQESAAGEFWALLMDGDVVRIRPLRPADQDVVRRMHAEMAPENQYLRFFAVSPRAPEAVAARLCRPPDAEHTALGAWLAGELVGVAHYERSPVDRADAEAAFAVADSAHGRGVATLLLEHLASDARAHGIHRFVAEVLVRNFEMLRVFADAGLRVGEQREHDVVIVEAYLDAGDSYLEAVAERERLAQTASLRHVFVPASVVVVGASERTGNVGGAVVRNLRSAGYGGKLAVVHPRARSVAGVSTWRRLAEVPFPVDLALLAVPAPTLPGVVEDCGLVGVRAVVILTSGVDATVGRAVRDSCHRYGMRLVGPNCLGVANPAHGLDLTFSARRFPAGRAGVAVQSGGVGIALSEHLGRLGIGVSSFASLGDKYDVSATDMLQLWYGDGQTKLAVLYVESFGNPRKFARVARRLATRMPVLAVDGGRSAPAQRAAASHTAAAATPTAARQALFADAGIIATNDLGDLVATTALVAWQPLPPGPRVAVISNAGGAGILAADACADAGLQLPELTESTRVQVAGLLPPGASVRNPVDAGAACGRQALARAAAVLGADPHVDAVLVLPVPTGLDDMAAALWPATRGAVVGVRLDQEERVRLEPAGEDGQVPTYSAPRDAAFAIARAGGYAAWRRSLTGTVPDPSELPGLSIARARAIVRTFLADHPGGGWLDPEDAAAFVATTGIEPVPVRLVRSPKHAGVVARELGFPVAIKAYGPDLLHKHHAQGVVLGVRSAARAREAYTALAARHREMMSAAVVQPMSAGDAELLVGASSDPVFGPVLAFGLGGTEADALADRVVRLVPLTDVAARETVRGFRAAKVLDQAASGGPVDVAALEDLVLRVSVLADRVPELADMDLNPVLARRKGLALVDVKVRLCPRRSFDPFLRRLR